MPVLLNVIFGLPQALSNLQSKLATNSIMIRSDIRLPPVVIICVGTDVLPAMSLVFEHVSCALSYVAALDL